MAIERTFSPHDWMDFANAIKFCRPGEFFYYPEDRTTGLADPYAGPPPAKTTKSRVDLLYMLSRRMHHMFFTPGRRLARWGARVCLKSDGAGKAPKLLRTLERLSKALLYDCRDCGDCSLVEIAFLCPESQCAKNQRNGPCGGTREGRCEVDGFGDCIWLQAYERLKSDGKEHTLLDHAPVVQDQGLRGTSGLGQQLARARSYRKRMAATTFPRSGSPACAGRVSDNQSERLHFKREEDSARAE